MKRTSLLVAPWLDTTVEVIQRIELVLSSKFGPPAHRAGLQDEMYKLHDLCTQFENDGESENEEAVYLCLFDALSYLTQALAQHPVNRGFLVEAVGILRRLRDERGTA